MTDQSARIAQLEAALRDALQSIYDIHNQFQDECYIGTPPGTSMEVVGFFRPYYDRKMEIIAAAENRIHAVIHAEGPVPVPLGDVKLADAWKSYLDFQRGYSAALAASAPASDTTAGAVQEAARVLLSLSNEAAQPALDACHGHYGQVAVKEFLRALAGETE